MKVPNCLFCLWILSLLTPYSLGNSDESVAEIPTDFDSTTFVSVTTTSESPLDNGMVIKDITVDTVQNHPRVLVADEEVPSVVESPSVLINFPRNHKNFTPSLYLGNGEYPPYYNHLNPYQHQYRNYFKQKEFFNRKPIRFEENSLKNYYLPQKVDHQDINRYEEKPKLNLKSFPYDFEKDRFNYNWHNTESGQIEVHETGTPSTELIAPTLEEPSATYFTSPYRDYYDNKFQESELHHFDNHDLGKTTYYSPWKKIAHFLGALVPLGLFLASITPSIVTINSVPNNKEIRSSDLENKEKEYLGHSELKFKEEDVLRLMKKYGIDSLDESQCEDRVLCELAVSGDDPSANEIERGFWYLAHQTPSDVAEKTGMNDLFEAIKLKNCETFTCDSKTTKNDKPPLRKKITRKRKVHKKTD